MIPFSIGSKRSKKPKPVKKLEIKIEKNLGPNRFVRFDEETEEKLKQFMKERGLKNISAVIRFLVKQALDEVSI
jgi:hypothetical protein